MRSRSSSFGQRSDDSTRDDNPSPQTPLDAGGNFVHSPPAIMNQRKSAFRSTPWTSRNIYTPPASLILLFFCPSPHSSVLATESSISRSPSYSIISGVFEPYLFLLFTSPCSPSCCVQFHPSSLPTGRPLCNVSSPRSCCPLHSSFSSRPPFYLQFIFVLQYGYASS